MSRRSRSIILRDPRSFSAGSSSSFPAIVTLATVILRVSICVTVGKTVGVRHHRTLSLISLSAADFWNWSERELVFFFAEFQLELVLMMTTKENCYLTCVICDLSGSSELTVELVHVSCVSWVSHDAVLPVPGKSLNLEQQRCFCILLSVPVFGLCSDLPNRIPLLHAVVPLWGLFPDVNPTMFWCQDLEQDSFSKRNNFLRVVFRSYAALNGVMPPALCAHVVTQTPK